MKTLADIKVGETVMVISIHGSGAIRTRLIDMGLVSGTTVYVHKYAPLGDPIQIYLRGYLLSIRKKEAGLIEVF